VREWVLLLAQKNPPRKGQPNCAAFGFLEMNQFRRARSHSLLVTQSLLHKKPGQYILVLAFATPIPSLTLLRAALRTSLSVNPPKSIHFQHTKRAVEITIVKIQFF